MEEKSSSGAREGLLGGGREVFTNCVGEEDDRSLKEGKKKKEDKLEEGVLNGWKNQPVYNLETSIGGSKKSKGGRHKPQEATPGFSSSTGKKGPIQSRLGREERGKRSLHGSNRWDCSTV